MPLLGEITLCWLPHPPMLTGSGDGDTASVACPSEVPVWSPSPSTTLTSAESGCVTACGVGNGLFHAVGGLWSPTARRSPLRIGDINERRSGRMSRRYAVQACRIRLREVTIASAKRSRSGRPIEQRSRSSSTTRPCVRPVTGPLPPVTPVVAVASRSVAIQPPKARWRTVAGHTAEAASADASSLRPPRPARSRGRWRSWSW